MAYYLEGLPVNTVAVVMMVRLEDGSLAAQYGENRDAVPATREQVIDVLMRLAVALDDQRIELDNLGDKPVG